LIKAIVIIFIVVAVLVGGLLTLRSSGRAGMPGQDVLERASKRARENAAEDSKEDGPAP
jgi:hypothetical protein